MVDKLLGYRETMDFEWEDSEIRKNWHEWLPVVMDQLWEIYPRRQEGVDHPFVPWRDEIRTLLKKGAPPANVIRAAIRYRQEIEAGDENTRKYMLGPVRFFRDGHWRSYGVPIVHGMTREEWARAGKDVQEFDRLLKAKDAL